MKDINLDDPMSTEEAFSLAKTYGESVFVTCSKQTHPDEVVGDFSYFSIIIDSAINFSSEHGYEEVFTQIDSIDTGASKAIRIAALRKELAELESS